MYRSTTSTTTNQVVPQRNGWLFSIWNYAVSSIWPSNNNDMDPNVSSSRFLTNFETQFGNIHPRFIAGSFQQACTQSKSEYKFLIVYLHSPMHQDTTAFCSNTLCTEMISDFFNDHFLCWAGTISHSDSYKVSNMLGASTYPFIAVICNNAAALTGSAMAMLDRIEGTIESEDLMARLTQILESHGTILTASRLEIEERDESRNLREEQDRAFLESLAEDESREQRQREEQRRIQDEKEAEEREAQRERSKLQEREKRKELCRQRIPVEPSATEEGVTQLVIRLTDGSRLQRRFKATDKLQVVFDFVDSSNEVDNYELVTNFPRKVFSDPHVTLKEAGLSPQAALFVQEK